MAGRPKTQATLSALQALATRDLGAGATALETWAQRVERRGEEEADKYRSDPKARRSDPKARRSSLLERLRRHWLAKTNGRQT